MFDDYKVAVVLDIFWKLLEFNPDEAPGAKDKKKMTVNSSQENLKKEPEMNSNK